MTTQDNNSVSSISGQPAAVRDKRTLPEGVVPRQAQGYVIAGLAVLILLAVMFSKNHAAPVKKDAAPSPLAASNDMNRRKIQELEEDLSAEQRQSQQAQKTANAGAATPAVGTAQPGVPAVPVASASTSEPPRDPVADAERELAFKSRFASNLIATNGAVPHGPTPLEEGNPSPSSSNTSAQQRIANESAESAKKLAPEVNVNSAHGQPYVVFEGTTIDAVLTNRLEGDFSGPVKVMVTNPVYSHDGQHLLIPEGAFILGEVQKVAGLGQKRLAVTFHRLLMPDGYSVGLDQFRGLDQIGATGLKDKVDSHYLEVFGTSIALGLIAGAAEATNSGSALTESGGDTYKSGVASSLSQSSANVLDRFLNIPPSLTIREGHRVKVYISQDLLLPAYENHTVPGDL